MFHEHSTGFRQHYFKRRLRQITAKLFEISTSGQTLRGRKRKGKIKKRMKYKVLENIEKLSFK